MVTALPAQQGAVSRGVEPRGRAIATDSKVVFFCDLTQGLADRQLSLVNFLISLQLPMSSQSSTQTLVH